MGKVTRCALAAYSLEKQVLVAPHRGLAQRHQRQGAWWVCDH